MSARARYFHNSEALSPSIGENDQVETSIRNRLELPFGRFVEGSQESLFPVTSETMRTILYWQSQQRTREPISEFVDNKPQGGRTIEPRPVGISAGDYQIIATVQELSHFGQNRSGMMQIRIHRYHHV
jgi:hypothetical protein